MGRARVIIALGVLAAVALSLLWIFPLGRKDGLSELSPDRTISIDLLAEVKGFVATIPGPGSGGYDRPTAGQAIRMTSAFAALSRGGLREAAVLARPLGYAVGRAIDTGTGRPLLVLAESRRDDGSWPHAWGLYIRSPGSTSPLTVEVPHALDDVHTPEVGVRTFRLAGAADLFVAGASRFADEGGAADLAHSSSTVFEAIHESVLRAGSVIFQPHGFDEQAHANYGDIVVSSGSAPPGIVASDVARRLELAGFDVCLYDGDHCSRLGATENVQGVSTRGADAQFLHMEMARDIRTDDAAIDAVAQAVAQATHRFVAGPSG